MKVRYVGVDGEISRYDNNITIGKIYKVIEINEKLLHPVILIDDIGERQKFSWDVLEKVEEVKEMTKSDLVTGLHAVELRNGMFFVVIGKHLLAQRRWMKLHAYEENLYIKQDECEFDDDYMNDVYDIVKVYKHRNDFDFALGGGLSRLVKEN